MFLNGDAVILLYVEQHLQSFEMTFDACYVDCVQYRTVINLKGDRKNNSN